MGGGGGGGGETHLLLISFSIVQQTIIESK